MGKIGGYAPPCENCGSRFSKVTDKRARDYDRAGDIYRRRECLECQFRFSTWEVGKPSYEFIKSERTARNRAKLLWQRIKSGMGIDRFENVGIIEPSEFSHEHWNHPIFVNGLENGVLVGLLKVFGFSREELQ